MKFKFRAEKKDFLIFLVFCLFLFLTLAIGVSNINSLATEGKFVGLNPLPGIEPPLLYTTLFFSLAIIFGTFLSVKGLFFDREEGFGFEFSKKSNGYSKWASEKDMKAQLKEVDTQSLNAKYAGVPLINKGGKLWVDDSEYHSLVIGSTGSGKTLCIVFPLVNSLAKRKESMIVTDPKGEIYEKTASMLKQRGYDIILLNFRNPQQGNAWNPMSLPYRLYQKENYDKAIELLDDLGINILYEENNNADPFWEKTAADYFSGISLGLFEDAEPEQINLNSVGLFSTVGDEKIGGSKYDKEYFKLKDPNSPAYINASGTVLAPTDTKGSIISVFKQKIKLFTSRQNLSEMLSYSDFEMETIGEKPTAVFIIIQDEKKTYHSLATIFIKQCYETLIDVAQKHGGKLPVRTNFILDEFANMPPLKDVTTMITASRSRLIRFTIIIQNFAQLNEVYGQQNAETIKGNCNNIIYLITTELQALEEISKLCGEVKSKSDEKTASVPLVTVSDLQKLKLFDVIIIRSRMNPFKTSLTPNFKINWGYKLKLATYPQREKKPVTVFDVREFVKAKKQERIKEMSEQMDEQEMIPNRREAFPFAPGIMPPFRERVESPYQEEKTIIPDSIVRSKKDTERANDDIDIDALVRKIDMKIAELEKEEAQEKEKQESLTNKENLSSNNLNVESSSRIEDVKPSNYEPVLKIPSEFQDVKPLEPVKPINDINRELANDFINTKLIEKEVNKSLAQDKEEKSYNNEENFFDDFFDN